MISKRNWERLGDVLAVVVAILLASAIVALAETPDDPPTAQAAPKPVKIELNQPKVLHLVAMPGPIAQDGGATSAEALEFSVAAGGAVAQSGWRERRLCGRKGPCCRRRMERGSPGGHTAHDNGGGVLDHRCTVGAARATTAGSCQGGE